MIELMRFPSAVSHCIEIDEWLSGEPTALYAMARQWFSQIRNCGPDVKELIHDGCPVACVGDAAFAYVNVFSAHVNVGFFLGASLKDSAGLLEGTGKRMRHVKIKRDKNMDTKALDELIDCAYVDMKSVLRQI